MVRRIIRSAHEPSESVTTQGSYHSAAAYSLEKSARASTPKHTSRNGGVDALGAITYLETWVKVSFYRAVTSKSSLLMLLRRPIRAAIAAT
jgi:hypothetical protein